MSLLVIKHLFATLTTKLLLLFVTLRAGDNFSSASQDARSCDSTKQAFRLLLLFGHSVLLFWKALLIIILTYFMAEAFGLVSENYCMGWNCEEIYCPEGYAVDTGEGLLPCDKTDEYNEGNKGVLR